LSSVITVPPQLRATIDELVKFALVKVEGRELQAYFDSASALMYEAFPKQVQGDYLSNQTGACQTYIHHGAHLSLQFANLHKAGTTDTLMG